MPSWMTRPRCVSEMELSISGVASTARTLGSSVWNALTELPIHQRKPFQDVVPPTSTILPCPD